MTDNPTPLDDDIDAILAERLRDPTFQDRTAMANERGTNLANEQFQTDLREMSQAELQTTYGREVALQRQRLLDGEDRLRASDNSDRTFGEVVSDSAVSAANALYRDVGTLGILAYAYGRGALDSDFNGRDEAANLLYAHGQIVSGVAEENLTDELQTRQYFHAIEGQLDSEDNRAQALREIEAGDDPFFVALREQGRNFMDSASRTLADPAVAGNLIAEGIGSLTASAPLAGAGGLVARGATATITRNTLAQRVSQATAISAAAGSTEVGGVYSETVNDIMAVPTEDLLRASPVMRALVAEGMTPEEAKVQLAGISAETAAIRQVPATLALGFITSRFEAMPIGSFANSGVARGLLQIAGEGIEEAGQGASGTVNRNLAVEEYAQIGRGTLDGVGEEAAIGALAGMGTAVAAGTPAGVRGAVRTTAQTAVDAANALFTEITYNDPLRQDIQGGSRASRAAETVRDAARPVTDAVAPAAQAVAGAARTAAQPVADAVNRINTRDERAQSQAEVSEAVQAARTVDEQIAREEIAPEVAQVIQEQNAAPSEGLADTRGSNLVETVGNIVTKMQQKGFKPSAEDRAFAAQQITVLKAATNSMTGKARRQVAKLVTSKFAQNVQQEATNLDLNKEDVSPETEVSTTVNVAKTNPTNVSPDKTRKILEESGENISPEDARYLRVASNVAEAINTRVENGVTIRRDENIGLAALNKDVKEETPVEQVSRQILSEGYTDRKGNSLRSINDFAAEIIQGSQSPDGTIINQNKEVVPVRQVAEQFAMFLEHMNNRVQALNTSYDNNTPNSRGRLTAPGGERYRLLLNGDTWVEPDNWTPGTASLFYHRSNPESVATAKVIAADRDTAYAIYETLSKEFPDLFEQINVPSLVQLKTDDGPTAVEESFDAPASEATSETEEGVQEQTPTETQDSEQPTGIDEEPVSEVEETNEATAERDDESEETGSEEGEQALDDDDEEAVRAWMDNPDQWTDEERARVLPMVNEIRNAAREMIGEFYGPEILKRLRQVTIYPKGKIGPGYAYVSEDGVQRKIYLSEEVFEDGKLTKLGRAVVLHEMAHVIDFSNARYTDDPGFISERNTFQPGGDVYQESLFLEGHSPWVKSRMDYVNDYKKDDPVQFRAEMFAVMTEFYFSKDGSILENSPAILALMEEVHGPRTRSETTGVTTDDEQTSTEESSAEEPGSGTPEPEQVGDFRERVAGIYDPDPSLDAPESVAQIQQVIENNAGINPVIYAKVTEFAPKILARMNERLNQIRTNVNGKNQSVLKHLEGGVIQEFMQYRVTQLADENGFDPEMIGLATVAFVDWLSKASGSDPNRLSDTLEKQGLSYADLNDEDIQHIALGIAPPQLKQQLANDILRMWGVRPNKAAKMVELQGVAQGLAAEMLLAMEAEGLYEVKRIKLPQVKEGTLNEEKQVVRNETDTILLNREAVDAFQKEFKDAQVEGTASTAKEYFFDESRERYTFEKPRFKRRKHLSNRENKALQKMEQTPHFENEELAGIFLDIGDENLMRALGYVEGITEETVPNGTLRRSYLGKNISITNNLADAKVLLDSITSATPVYYPVGVTSVGRHQYQGVNPQSNKILRALVTPTWSNVDVANDQDSFWLAVAQAADLMKIEKRSHADVLANVQAEFNTKYGASKDMMLERIRGGELDGSAFVDTLGGTVEPQVLSAIYAVAQMQHAQETGQQTIRMSLSVELDGVTNGAANMMVNFAQGILSPEAFENFKKVGLYLGKAGQTLNKYFGNPDNLDMYETVARNANFRMTRQMADKRPEVANVSRAAFRMASVFGDFKQNPATGEYEMSRNSAKNPMTKVNYGSGVLGVGTGIADDILLNFLETLHNTKVDGNNLVDIPYVGDIVADFATLGIRIPTNPDAKWEPSKADLKMFRENIANSIGAALTDGAKEVLGPRITEVNDMLVFSTNVQAAYLNEMFETKMLARAEELAADGTIRRNPKTKKPIISDIPQQEYDTIVAELESMAPIFTSDEQTLELGGFKVQIARDWPVLASAMDGRLNQKPLLKQPDDVGVKAIPFTVIGTGDAMMMNLIFGQDNAPEDVLGVFDGLDVPFTKLKEYAPMVNQKVYQTWQRDVLSMPVENFRGFLAGDLDQDALKRAFATAKEKSKKSTVTATNPGMLLDQLDQRLAENRAFKSVLSKIPLSVDQMAGSDVGFSQGEGTLGVNAINDMIRRALDGRPVETVEEIDEVDVKNPVEELTLDAVIRQTRFTEPQRKVLEFIQPLLGDTRVVYGTLDQLNVWRRENVADDGHVLTAGAQWDYENDIIFMTTTKPESLLHELVHAGTFQKVFDHYSGERNPAVERLEVLMDEFLAIENGSAKVREAQAAILTHKAVVDPFHKAAAVNEMMAYVLANHIVRKKAQETKAGSLATWAKKVLQLARRLLGNAPESIYDAVSFNTQILHGEPVSSNDTDTGGNGDGGSTNDGGEMTPPANNYTNYWIKLLSDYLNDGNNIERILKKDEQVKAREEVNRIVDGFRQVGMLQNDEARMTFKAIYGVINSDISLKSQPVIAITNMFNHIVENMTPEMFGDGPEASQEYSAVLNSFSKTQSKPELINSISTLLALSQTSAKFRSVLDQIPEPETGETSRKLQDTLTQFAGATMATITATVNESGNAQQVLDRLAATIVEHDQEREWLLLRKVTASFEAADNYTSGVLNQVSDTMQRVDERTKMESRSKTRQYITSAVTLGTNYLSADNTELSNRYIKNRFHMGIPFLDFVPVRELVSEIVGTDRINRNVVSLQDKVNHAISGMRQAYREDLPGILQGLFAEKPTADQWQNMYRVLAKTDFTSVIDPANINAGMQMVADQSARSRRIRALETTLDQKLVPYVAQDAKDKAEQLANYMTGGGAGVLLVRNAYAIAKNLDGEFDSTLVPVIDELISLHAINMLDSDQRQGIVDLFNSDPDAIEQIVTYIQGLNAEEDAKPNVSEMAKLNAWKGYIPNEGKKNFRIVVEDDSNELDMKTRGFRKVKSYEGDPGQLVDRSYYVTETRAGGQYAQGTLQNVAATYRGVDVNTGLSTTGETTGYISGDGVVARYIEQMLEPTFQLDDPKESLVPVFAEDGSVSGFERAINPDLLDQHAGRDENLAIMLGAWAGRQLEETTAYEYNIALIDELDKIYQNRERGEDGLFVNMKDSDDPIYRESFRLIPNNIKAYIDSKFDGNGFMVRKDMANLSVGYREASLADMWSGKSRMPKDVQKAVVAGTQLFMGRNAMKWVVKAEDVLQGAVSTAKDIIVVRSLIVPMMNIQANIVQLATRGVPMKTLKRDMQRKLAEVEKYNENVTKIIELKARQRLKARDANQKRILQDKIDVLEDLKQKMSIAPMIAAGAYKQLSEGITEFDTSMTDGKLGDYVEGVVEKLPPGLQTIGKYGIVSKSTRIYQIANRATQYGDFLAKSIYYDHLLSKGLDAETAVRQINEEFVNFTTQPGRVRSALERNGMLWFPAFKLRIAKIALQQLRDNPVRALAVNVALDVGSPIQDNIFTVIAEGRLDYATGYEMLFAAPELNPWVNLMSD